MVESAPGTQLLHTRMGSTKYGLQEYSAAKTTQYPLFLSNVDILSNSSFKSIYRTHNIL